MEENKKVSTIIIILLIITTICILFIVSFNKPSEPSLERNKITIKGGVGSNYTIQQYKDGVLIKNETRKEKETT